MLLNTCVEISVTNFTARSTAWVCQKNIGNKYDKDIFVLKCSSIKQKKTVGSITEVFCRSIFSMSQSNYEVEFQFQYLRDPLTSVITSCHL